MRKTLLGLAVVALSAGQSLSADLLYEQSTVPPTTHTTSAYDWSGFYLGAQGGYAWNQGSFLGSDTDIDSGTAGVHLGYNFQSGNFVYGIENDVNYNFEENNGANLEWDASGRARVGYALDRTLVFATAGVAAAGGQVEVSGADKNDDILIGWTAGGGIEHAISDEILVRGEYRYSDFGNKDFGSSIGDFGATQHKVLLGASYKF